MDNYTNILGITMLYCTLLNNIITFIWKNVIPIMASYYGIRWYELTGTKMQKIQKKIYISTSRCSDESHKGWFIGKGFFGVTKDSYRENGTCDMIYVFCHQNLIDTLEVNPNNINTLPPINTKSESKSLQQNESGNIVEYYYEGETGYYRWNKRKMYPYNITPNKAQKNAIECIRKEFNRIMFGENKKYCIAMLYGETGSGKSTVGLILANILSQEGKNVNIVDSYDPTTPGETFIKIYNKIEPDDQSPLIIILEEFDTIITRITNGIVEHPKMTRNIHNKTTWNSFFDRFGKGVYKNIYFLLTTNKMPEWFDGEDPSYTRKGRFDIKINV